ncbi:Ig-like domain-containing protein, partial [Shewanella marisflavi]|uniref:Ig-like domain-containing protein n=1 Tax=Shewanella marisflavi TaxID=260364 RepID=UPI003AAEF09B
TAGTTVNVEGGSLVINADGSYTFTPNDNWNGSVPVITYTTNTGESATLTINVTPVDAPSILANDSNTVSEDTVASGNVLDNDSDIDSELSVVSFSVDGQTVTAGTTVEVEGGSLVINADGSYTFSPNQDWNGSVPVITYTTNTGESATLTINVTPINDAADVSSASVTLTETNDPLTTGGTLTATDVDNPDNTFTPLTVEGTYGTFTLLGNGEWTFTANSAFDELNVGDSYSETFNVT